MSEYTYTWTCHRCGAECSETRAIRGGMPRKWCGRKCAKAAEIAARKLRPNGRTCEACGSPLFGYQKSRCSRRCSARAATEDATRARRETMAARRGVPTSAIGAALISEDPTRVLAELERGSRVNGEGCWVWPAGSEKYPLVRVCGQVYRLHRVALEASIGMPLGRNQAHHKCANSMCVNPGHLQPVTNAENVAEMNGRRAYLDRIRELEQALEQLDPLHPLLQVLPITR